MSDAPGECYYCGFTSRVSVYELEDDHLRCKSRRACKTRIMSGKHLKRHVRLQLELISPTILDPPLQSAERARADKHERYRKGICIDCGERRHSPGRPRCDSCHFKLIEWRGMGTYG